LHLSINMRHIMSLPADGDGNSLKCAAFRGFGYAGDMENPAPSRPDRYGTIAVYFSIYAGWFGCVLLGKYKLELLSPLIPLSAAMLFQAVYRPALAAWRKALILVAIGTMADFIAVRLGLLQLPPGETALPVWLLSLWLLFAPTLFLFRCLFGQRWWLAAIAGALGGPLCYTSGARFDVLELNGWPALTAYAVFWALYLPVAMHWLAAPTEKPTSA